METVWDEMIIILKELLMLYQRLDDVRDKLFIRLSYKNLSSKLTHNAEEITFYKVIKPLWFSVEEKTRKWLWEDAARAGESRERLASLTPHKKERREIGNR